MLNPWVMFLVGLVLGWLLTWLLQRRLDDSLTAQVSQLQRELSEANQRLGAATSAPASAPMAETSVQAERAVALTAIEEAEQLAPPSEPAHTAPEDSDVVEAVAETWDTAGEAVTEQPAVEEAHEAASKTVDEVVASIFELPPVQEIIETVSQAEPAGEEPAGADDLTIIKGIGPKFAETLNAAGITTFAGLAKLSPEELEQIIKPAAWQKVEFAEWIAQASEQA